MAIHNIDDRKQKQTFPFKSLWNCIKNRRNDLAFWIFGMGTHFVFIITLSAAHDILDPKEGSSDTSSGNASSGKPKNFSSTGMKTTSDEGDILYCNPLGTGMVLICSVLPDLILKLLVQFSPKDISYHLKAGGTVVSSAVCFVLLAFGNVVWIRLVGVVFSAITFGLGETTFLPLTSSYEKSTVSSWSSGTGGAGILATIFYAGFTTLKIPREVFMMSLLIVPALMAVGYARLLKPLEDDSDIPADLETKTLVKNPESLTFIGRIKLLPSMLKYLTYLGISFLTSYFINQGLIELLYFNGQFITRKEQYRWFQVIYRVGVFIGRLGLPILIVKQLWLPPMVLCGLVGVLTSQIFYRFIPYLWIIFMIVFAEGIFQGVSYVSVFISATENRLSLNREFTLGVLTLAAPLGILMAGIIATPFHNLVCSLHLRI